MQTTSGGSDAKITRTSATLWYTQRFSTPAFSHHRSSYRQSSKNVAILYQLIAPVLGKRHEPRYSVAYQTPLPIRGQEIQDKNLLNSN